MAKRSPIHPAILAMRAVVAAFIITEQAAGRVVGRLLTTDLSRHDEPRVREYPAAPFAWIVHPMGTHLYTLLPDGARGEVDRQGAKPWPQMVAESFSLDTLPNAGFYLWADGLLLPCSGPDELHARMRAINARTLIQEQQGALVSWREDLAAAGEGESLYRSRLQASIARREADLASLEGIRRGELDEATSLEPRYTVSRRTLDGWITLCTNRSLRNIPVGLGGPYIGPGEYRVKHGDGHVTYCIEVEARNGRPRQTGHGTRRRVA